MTEIAYPRWDPAQVCNAIANLPDGEALLVTGANQNTLRKAVESRLGVGTCRIIRHPRGWMVYWRSQ